MCNDFHAKPFKCHPVVVNYPKLGIDAFSFKKLASFPFGIVKVCLQTAVTFNLEVFHDQLVVMMMS